jgi:hypothetical protein
MKLTRLTELTYDSIRPEEIPNHPELDRLTISYDSGGSYERQIDIEVRMSTQPGEYIISLAEPDGGYSNCLLLKVDLEDLIGYRP